MNFGVGNTMITMDIDRFEKCKAAVVDGLLTASGATPERIEAAKSTYNTIIEEMEKFGCEAGMPLVAECAIMTAVHEMYNGKTVIFYKRDDGSIAIEYYERKE